MNKLTREYLVSKLLCIHVILQSLMCYSWNYVHCSSVNRVHEKNFSDHKSRSEYMFNIITYTQTVGFNLHNKRYGNNMLVLLVTCYSTNVTG
jgi:hypothetical protein